MKTGFVFLMYYDIAEFSVCNFKCKCWLKAQRSNLFIQNYLNGWQLIPQKSYLIKVQIGFLLSPAHFRKSQVARIIFFVKPFHQDWRMSQSAIEAKYICFGVFGQSGKSSMR